MPHKVKTKQTLHVGYFTHRLEQRFKVTFKGKVINLLKSITVKLWDKFKVRHMMGSQPILFSFDVKTGI